MKRLIPHTLNFSSARKKYEIVIVGGGAIGSSIALHLSLKGQRNILVVERDPSYKNASCMLSAGGIRQQFSVEENIKMSMYGISFLKNISELVVEKDVIPDVQFHENGYLFLATRRDVLIENYETQKNCGIDWVKLYEPHELSNKFPWLNVSNLNIGSFGLKNEGYFDPWAFVAAMKNKAIQLGVEYVEGDVKKVSLSNNEISSLTTSTAFNDSETVVQGNVYVNATGANAGKFVEMLNSSAGGQGRAFAPLPVRPRKRSVFVIHSRHAEHPMPPRTCPLLIDPSGVWFRPEGRGGLFVTGYSPAEDPDCEFDHRTALEPDHSLFQEAIWPALAERVPAFEELRVQSAWAGCYEYNTFDQNAVIGYHPDVPNLMLCNGFSGHGLQQSPAAGRAVAELLLDGRFLTLDLSRLAFHRLIANTPVLETGIV